MLAAAKARGMVPDEAVKHADSRSLAPIVGPSEPKKAAEPRLAGLAKPRALASLTLPTPAAITFTIPGEPMGKPRMTQRDKWKKRPCVVRYRAWADKARESAPANLPTDPLVVSWTAYFSMPASWSAKKRNFMRGTFHRQKCDRDNVDKGILDALFKSDCGIAGGTLVKRWDDGQGPRVIVQVEGVC